MKKLVLITLIFVVAIACKKTEFSPEGPTDVRVKNISDVPFTSVSVNTSGGDHTLGDASAGGFTAYVRYDKAYPKAEISVMINGQLYSTGSVNYNGMTYIGQAKITYEVYISDAANKKLTISNCSLDAPLD